MVVGHLTDSRRWVLRVALVGLLIPIVAVAAGRIISARTSVSAQVVAMVKGAQPTCGTRTNCSMVSVEASRVPKLSVAQLTRTIETDGGSLESVTTTSIHAVYRSALFQFPDDLLVVVSENGTVTLWSASRLGASDMGVNSNRTKRLVAQLIAAARAD